jgi:hypothetical protein
MDERTKVSSTVRCTRFFFKVTKKSVIAPFFPGFKSFTSRGFLGRQVMYRVRKGSKLFRVLRAQLRAPESRKSGKAVSYPA